MSRSQYIHHKRIEPAIDAEWIAVAVIVGAIGIKGMLRLKSFSDDLQKAFDRGPVMIFPDQHSDPCDITLRHQVKAGHAVQISGVNNRDEAEALKGVKLYVKREKLPEIKEAGSYYHDDLLGLIARDTNANPFGTVTAIYNFGAGDVVEITLNDAEGSITKMYPFRDQFVPEVDIHGGFMVIDRVAFGDVGELS